MSELDLVYDGKVVHAGIFDFKSVYQFIYDWFQQYSYLVIEKKYSEKIKAEGKEVEVIWTCFRKISDYFRFNIKMTMRILNMTTVEVPTEKGKAKRNQGEMEVKFSCYLEKDYDQKWDQQPLTKFFRGLYDKYIIQTRIEEYEDKMRDEVEECMAQIKAYLALEGKR